MGPRIGRIARTPLEPRPPPWHYRLMLIALLLAAQAAAAQPAPPPAVAATAPDIELDIRATIREVRIRQRGDTSLEVRAEPDGGSLVDVDRPDSGGRTRLRNVDVRVKAEARIADPADIRATAETDSPQ